MNPIASTCDIKTALQMLQGDLAIASHQRVSSKPEYHSPFRLNLAPDPWADRTVVETVDRITTSIVVKSAPKTNPNDCTYETKMISEEVITICDPANGTTTSKSVQATGACSSAKQIALSADDVVTEDVSIVDQRTTTEIEYSTQDPSTKTIASATTNTTNESLNTSNTFTVGTASPFGSLSDVVSNLAAFLGDDGNLSALLKGPDSPTFMNVLS